MSSTILQHNHMEGTSKNNVCKECYYASLCQNEDNLDEHREILKEKFI